MAKNNTINDAEVGDSVTYRTPQNQTFTGKVVIRMPEHVVINRRGMAKCVDANNFVSMRKGKNRREYARWI